MANSNENGDIESIENVLSDISINLENISFAQSQVVSTLSSTITLEIAEINHSLSSIDNTIENVGKGSFFGTNLLIVLASTIIAGFVAYLFNRLHWLQVLEIERKKSIGQKIIDLLDSIESISVPYWLFSYSADKSELLNEQEIKIKSEFRFLRKYISIFFGKAASNLGGEKMDLINENLEDLFEELTGGNFESTQRQSSKERANKIYLLCSKMKGKITEYINES